MIKYFRVSILLILAVFAFNIASGSTDTNNNFQTYGYGNLVSMTELAEDGQFVISSTQPFCNVDANSILVVSFKTTDKYNAPEDLKWHRLHKILERIDDLTAKRASLVKAMSEVKLTSAEDISNFRKKADEFLILHNDFIHSISSTTADFPYPLLTKEEFDDIASSDEGKTVFENVMFWAKRQLNDLNFQAESLARSGRNMQVFVEAYLDSKGQNRKAIHVPEYDSLPEGKLEPINKDALVLTSSEQAKLNRQLESSQQAVSQIKEIQAKSNILRDKLDKLKNVIEDGLQQQNKQLSDAVIRIKTKIDEAKALLSEAQKRTDESTDQHLAIQSLLSSIDQKSTLIGDIKGLIKDLEQVDQQIKSTSFNEIVLLASSGKFPNYFDDYKIRIESIKTKLDDKEIEKIIMQKLADIEKDIKAKQTVEEMNLLWTNTTVQAKVILMNVNNILSQFQDVMSDGVSAIKGEEALSNANMPSIPHELNNTPDAIIDLRRVGITAGDTVSVVVRFQDPNNKNIRPEEIKYSAQAVLAGVHREISGQLIFAQAFSGPGSEKVKPNVAVLAIWKYWSRSKPHGFWNWFGFGAGIHAASLDQGSGAAELGTGVNITLLQKLVDIGYGWNLSVSSDKPYWFIGLKLTDLLGKSR